MAKIGEKTVELIVEERDSRLTLDELTHFGKNVDWERMEKELKVDGLWEIVTEHMPPRYVWGDVERKTPPIEPFTPARFMSYFEYFHVDIDGNFFERSTGRKIIKQNALRTFKYIASYLYKHPLWPISPETSVDELLDLVEDHADVFFVDGLYYADFIVNGTPLPNAHTLGPLGAGFLLENH